MLPCNHTCRFGGSSGSFGRLAELGALGSFSSSGGAALLKARIAGSDRAYVQEHGEANGLVSKMRPHGKV